MKRPLAVLDTSVLVQLLTKKQDDSAELQDSAGSWHIGLTLLHTAHG